MTEKKRGLGRGLEALLAEDASKSANRPPPENASTERETGGAQATDPRTAMVLGFVKELQKEHIMLQQEAESLKDLLDEFESIIRADDNET